MLVAPEHLVERAARFASRRVLITGGLGFIGSHLARALAAAGAEVTLVDSLIPEYGGNLFNIAGLENAVRVNISDVRDAFSLEYLVRGVDYIFNLAGQTSHMDSMTNPRADLEINCAAQLSLLESCRRLAPSAKLVFASTRQIYGRPQYLPVDEKHPLSPTDVNGVNKIAGEMYHILYHDVYGLRSTALRLTNTYGPCMRVKDARQTFLGIWIRNAVEGTPFEVWGGDQLRDFSYVDDTVEALLCAADESVDGKAYNIAGDSVISLKAVAQKLSDISGAPHVIREFPADRKKIDIGDYYADDAAFRSLTGWSARTAFQDGLQATLDFYKRNLKEYL